MHACLDEVVADPAQHIAADPTRAIDWRNQIWKDAVKSAMNGPALERRRLSWVSGIAGQHNATELSSARG